MAAILRMRPALRLQWVWILFLVAAGCGERDERAWETGDPLHARGIGLPPPAEWSPPAADAPPEMIRVRRPPLSPGVFPCSTCHEGGASSADAAPVMPHKIHLERDLTCADCHAPDGEKEPKVPAVALCFDCHDDLAGDSERVRTYFAGIETPRGTYEFPRRWKTRDTIANHAGHAAAGVDCADCHGPPADTAYAKPKAVPLMARCIDCHTRRAAPVACADCHREIRDPAHGNIVLRHAEEQRGCLDCHHPDDRDVLRLADGTAIPFEESYRLCGQCHGPKLRDWKRGLHGKRTGMWDGRKEYLLCVHCHQDPHQPRFPAMTPDPPPVRPGDIR